MSATQSKSGEPLELESAAFWRAIRARHPPLRVALVEDARVTAMHRGERHQFRSRTDAICQIVRLSWVSDAFLGQVLYRFKARGQALGIPIVPRLAHRLAMAIAQISIGDPVIVDPGVYVVHGHVVADGLVEIGAGVVISPFVTIGLRAGDVRGPIIEPNVNIGTGAKLLGHVRVGTGATIGANAVVIDDVPAGTTAVGVPARTAERAVAPPGC